MYHKRRALLRRLFLVFTLSGIVLVRFTGGDVDFDSSSLAIAAAIGLFVGFIVLVVLDSTWTTCPGCTASFRRPLPQYDEGLPLFNNP